jgi:hypothetical protein
VDLVEPPIQNEIKILFSDVEKKFGANFPHKSVIQISKFYA